MPLVGSSLLDPPPPPLLQAASAVAAIIAAQSPIRAAIAQSPCRRPHPVLQFHDALE
jgi:hypothetical protein